MTRKEMEKIRNLNGVVQMYQKELDLLKCKSLIKGQEITGMPFNTGTSDKVGDLASEMAEYEIAIQGKLAEMQLLRKRIMNYIDTVEDNLMKQIFYYWNICCMSWNQVANSVSGDNTEDSVKKMYYRYFDKS